MRDHAVAHAALFETVSLVARLGYARAKGFVNGVLRSAQREIDAGHLWAGGGDPAAVPLAVRTSHPDWMVGRWRAHYGYTLCESICEANNAFAGLTLRVEPGPEAREAVLEALGNERVTAEAHSAWAGAVTSA